MKNSLLLFLIIPLLHNTSFAQQTATEAVKQSVNTLFNAMRNSDSTALRSVFAKGMILQSISTGKEGRPVLTTEDVNDFARSVAAPHKAIYDERISFGDIKIDGDLAMVWAPYKFYLGDKFSHCGVDVFQLMKTADGWKIIYIVDTRRKDNCIE